jgi:hypothetical protein
MYKFTVSCYYWPAAKGPLRQRNLTISERTERSEKESGSSSTQRSGSLIELTMERRRTRRLRVRCDAELFANLAILDSDAPPSEASLLFFGHTRDLSATNIGFVLPATQIDDKYCDKTRRVKLSVHFPDGPVSLEVRPVRCVPLNPEFKRRGYFVAAEIVSVGEARAQFERFLELLSGAKR